MQLTCKDTSLASHRSSSVDLQLEDRTDMSPFEEDLCMHRQSKRLRPSSEMTAVTKSFEIDVLFSDTIFDEVLDTVTLGSFDQASGSTETAFHLVRTVHSIFLPKLLKKLTQASLLIHIYNQSKLVLSAQINDCVS